LLVVTSARHDALADVQGLVRILLSCESEPKGGLHRQEGKSGQGVLRCVASTEWALSENFLPSHLALCFSLYQASCSAAGPFNQLTEMVVALYALRLVRSS